MGQARSGKGLHKRMRPSAANAVIRDHLFISYAWEDQAFARWLALRLTSEGYKVWIDQFKLLGGESWPRHIDTAIKTRAFRLLGLLSKHSITKPKPLKERTLAVNIASKPGMQGFLVPLNVDGLASTDLDWLTSDVTFISFAPSWAKGLLQLLKLLERDECPKFKGDGRAIAARVAAASELVLAGEDRLTTNVCPFIQVPSRLSVFLVNPKLEAGPGGALHDAQRDWACYPVSPYRVLAFHPPGQDLATWLRAESVRSYDWRSAADIEGLDARDVVARLLRGCVETRLRLGGYWWSDAARALCVPGALGQKLHVILPDGAETTVQHSGERTLFRVGQPKMPYRYRIAAKFSVERSLFAEFALIWRLRLHLTDARDEPLPEGQRLSRRKHLTRSWFNRQWLVRHLAILQHCMDEEGLLRIGPPGESQVVLDCHPLGFVVPKTIDEGKLKPEEEIGDDVPVVDNADDDVEDE